jgi:hypothetical protein
MNLLQKVYNLLNEVAMATLVKETPTKTKMRSITDVSNIKVLRDTPYKKGRYLQFEVTGSTGKTYRPSIYLKNKYDRMGEARARCNCPAWKWWGSGYNASNEDYRIRKTSGDEVEPNVRDPKRRNKLCKHVVACLDEIKKLEKTWKQKEFKFMKKLPKEKQLEFIFNPPETAKGKEKQMEFGE